MTLYFTLADLWEDLLNFVDKRQSGNISLKYPYLIYHIDEKKNNKIENRR